MQVRDPQIVQNQSTFVISDSVNHLGIHDNSIKRNQVGNEETDLVSLVEDIEQSLLPERNISQTKLNCQRVFIWLLNQPVTKRVKNSMAQPTILKTSSFASNVPLFVSTRVH